MIIYDGTKTDFFTSVDNDTIADEIEQKIQEKMHRTTGAAEFRSWKNSLGYMYKVLNDTAIPADAGIAIEYNIPQTSKRVDFLISGYDEDSQGNVIIIELKQWESLQAIDGKDALVETYTGGANRLVVHPCYQAWSYAAMIRDYNATVQDTRIGLHPCAYLHNYVRKPADDPLDAPQYALYEQDTPAFTSGQVLRLRAFIEKYIHRGDHGQTIYEIDHGRIRPSRSLQDSIAAMLRGNREFVMIDDQKVVYERILELARQCKIDGRKRTMIVQGGPGTGKTVVAINLLAQLTRDGQFAQYTSKNSAPRNVYLRKLKGQIRRATVDGMFKGSGSYVDAPKGLVDTILADEAHRLNRKSGMFHNLGENQIREIIHASLCSVFFIDESQRVTLQDIGSVSEIKRQIQAEGSILYMDQLTSQFRCNGSDAYLAWLDNTLQIRQTANPTLEDTDYDFQVIDDPQQLYDLILAKDREGQLSRILAGYCWEWPSKTRKDPDYHDIRIGDFGISWNLSDTATYAIDPDSVHEAGCIHTTQGLEFAYVGVIIGNDLRCEDGKIVTDYTARASTDQSLRGIKKMAKADPEEAERVSREIICNTYRTLMTRGMRGCYVYCTDPALADYLRSCIGR